MRRCKALVLVLIVVALTTVRLADAGPVLLDVARWPNAQEALEAAANSGKPVYAYVYSPDDATCMRMQQATLVNSGVRAALGDYQVCAMNIHNPQNQQFLQQHKVLPPTDEERLIKTYRLPTSLFLNSKGQEVYRRYGYLPLRWFMAILTDVKALIGAQSKVEAKAHDASTYAELGHLCMRLQMYDKARQYLTTAVRLDPHNQAGAKDQARLDLIIMAIPDNPQQASDDLQNYLRTYSHSPRRLEARYYMAVAQLAANRVKEAVKILQTFETSDKSAPEYDSPWTPHALGLLRRLRGQTDTQ